MTETVMYSCVDAEYNVWKCAGCGHLAYFEADGPVENDWHFCPKCGKPITPEEEDI